MDEPQPTVEEAEAACEAARQRLGLFKGRARFGAVHDARGSTAQASLRNARSSPESLASILSRWETSLPTTGAPSQDSAASSSTGQPLGATGAVVSFPAPREGAPRGLRRCSASTKTPSTLTHVEIARLLIELDVLTKHRAETDEEKRLRLNTYRERLADLDGGAVAKAINDWPNTHDWWPSWAELKREIDGWL